MMSCKKSIKANHYLKNNEMADLIDQLREAEDPFTCLMADRLLSIFKLRIRKVI